MMHVRPICSRCVLTCTRYTGTLITKVTPCTPHTATPDPPNIPWENKLSTRRLMARYFETPKAVPDLIYDYTDHLQLVKPYITNIKTHIRKAQHMTLHEFTMKTSRIPMPKSMKSQFITRQLESGRVLIDGKVMPGSKILAGKSSIVTKHHRHEIPVPRFDVATLAPHKLSNRLTLVDKPAGLPCIPDMRYYAYNSLEFVLHVFHATQHHKWLYNDIGQCSGVVMISSNRKAADKLWMMQQAGRIKFVYLLRVYGRFDKRVTEVDFAGTGSENREGVGSVEMLGYDINTDTSLLRVECFRPTVQDICGAMAGMSHTVVNDWASLRQQDAYITDSLTVQFGKRIGSLFDKSKLLEDVQQTGSYIMRDPLAMQAHQDYVINPQKLKLTPELSKYYKQYQRVQRDLEHIETCAECLNVRQPLPVHLMSPQIHLLCVESENFSFMSKQSVKWL